MIRNYGTKIGSSCELKKKHWTKLKRLHFCYSILLLIFVFELFWFKVWDMFVDHPVCKNVSPLIGNNQRNLDHSKKETKNMVQIHKKGTQKMVKRIFIHDKFHLSKSECRSCFASMNQSEFRYVFRFLFQFVLKNKCKLQL